LEVLRAYRTLFFHQEKSFHDHGSGQRLEMCKFLEISGRCQA